MSGPIGGSPQMSKIAVVRATRWGSAALAALTCALVLPAVAAAGPVKGPPSFHERIVDDFIDEDFCGTGADVSVHFEGLATVWETEDAFKVLFNDTTWLTYNGVTLVDHF